MRRVIVFNQVSLDGYFVDTHGDMSWAHAGAPDPEWQAFVESNARGDANERKPNQRNQLSNEPTAKQVLYP